MFGYEILAQALAKQGVKFTYGIVGIPVIQLGYAMQSAGISYYGFRNEQQAAYSAGYTGYLTGMPGACLCVSGPGHTNAISGVLNAWVNTWPMILISGSNDLNQTSRQAFQEVDQVYFVKPYTKYSVRITSAEDIPYHVEKAVRLSITGRPGPVYLDMPGDVLNQKVNSNVQLRGFITPAISYPNPQEVFKAVYVAKVAKRPLIIVGKGAAYGRAEKQVTALVQSTGIPFLPTPMGKGVVPDSHHLNISPARSMALKQADIIILIGARLNWILHFGLPPRFNPNVKIIQIDVLPEEHDHNIPSHARLVGDCKVATAALLDGFKGYKLKQTDWVAKLKQKCKKNLQLNESLIAEDTSPMTYYNSMGTIKKFIPADTILVGEGANTMDIGRTIFSHQLPRRKLDAGTFGTMGIGLAAIVSAQTANPELWTVAVMGDSAFGFSAMECETMTRYKLGAVIFIINNNGIYSGTDVLEGEPKDFGVTHLNPDAKYEKIAEAFGGKGYNVSSKTELAKICKQIFVQENRKKLIVVNVHIEPSASKKPQESEWLTRKSPNAKL